MLKMFEPTTLPKAISDCPCRTAAILTTISGELVQKATTVSPTTRGVIPSLIAIEELPLTKLSAPKVKKSNETMSNIMSKYTFTRVTKRGGP
jgi:hypothetical protein